MCTWRCTRAGADLGLRMPATTRSTRCASKPAAAPGAPNSGPTKRPGRPAWPFAVKLDKAGDFIGREALLTSQGQPLRKKLLSFVLDSPAAYAWGGEAILDRRRGRRRTQLGRLEPEAGACVGLGYVRGDAAQRVHRGTPVVIDLWGEPMAATAWDLVIRRINRR